MNRYLNIIKLIIFVVVVPFVCVLVHIQIDQIKQSTECLQLLLRSIEVEDTQQNGGV